MTPPPAPVPSRSPRICVLPPEVAGQIAAGEVVERPASVVKELVENSLDAGATRILIELEGAGSELIAVVDDGEGMSPQDAVTAFARHATSKVRSADDLERITTMGFRGEALASIAAVSRTTLVTRRHEDLSGTRVEIAGCDIVDVRETGAPPGTRIEVAGLFARTPARRKFLKSAATEVAHVTELVTRTAIAWPQVGFTLRHEGRKLLEMPAVADPAERVRQVYGSERMASLMSFADRGSAGSVHGWLGDSRLNFPTPRQIYTYVNRRYVRDKLVSHALTAGYSTLLMHGRYPAAVVFLDVPPQEVDVNVHPAKSEVRFRMSGGVHELIARAVQTRLRGLLAGRPAAAAPSPPEMPSPQFPLGWSRTAPGSAGRLQLVEMPSGPPASPGSTAGPGGAVTSGVWARTALGAALAGCGTEGSSGVVPRMPPATDAGHDGFFSGLRVVGQVFDGYLVCECDDALVLIDQHAAHERVTFEGLRAAYGTRTVARQKLLVPAVVEVGTREAALIVERAGELDALGFEVEPFGGKSFTVRAVPALLGDADPAALLRDVAEELVEVGRSRKVAEAAESVLARLACHSAVRVGQSLAPHQIQSLLRSMDRIDFAGNCPHGRPAFIRIGRGEIERWFKRT